MANSLTQGFVSQGARTDGPFADSASTRVGLRASKWGELVNLPYNAKMTQQADEGSYFVATTPTPGTGIIGAASSVAADALAFIKADLYIENTGASGAAPDNKRIYLDYLKLIVVTAGAASSTLHYTTHVDTCATSRYTSGGTAITPLNVFEPSSSTQNSLIYFGALVIAAGNSCRLIGNGLLRQHIEIAGDTYIINFGGDSSAAGIGSDMAGTTSPIVTVNHCPVVIPPKCCFQLLTWAASKTTGTTYEMELGYWVR